MLLLSEWKTSKTIQAIGIKRVWRERAFKRYFVWWNWKIILYFKLTF